MKKYTWVLLVGILAVLCTIIVLTLRHFPGTGETVEGQQKQVLVVNEAAHTLLYLPIYHAVRMGYFRDEGIDLKIVTAGSAATAVAAVISGDADAALADPMYAPISRAKGSEVVVIGQLVGRVGLWALQRPGTSVPFNGDGLRNSSIITHPKPMSSYTYTELLLQEFGIPEAKGHFIEAKPGTEVATYRSERSAPFIVTVEPAVSILQDEGATVVHSWPREIGDRVFSGIMVERSTLSTKRKSFSGFLRAIQRSLADIAGKGPAAVATAREYFPGLEDDELRAAIRRLTDEQVFPRSVEISQASWDSAVAARKRAGDLTTDGPYQENVMHGFTSAALLKD